MTEMSFRISGNHSLQRTAPDQLKTASHVSPRDKISFLLALRLRTKGSDIGQGGVGHAFAERDTALWDEFPIDRFDWVERAGEVLVTRDQPLDLLGLETDIGIDEQQMR